MAMILKHAINTCNETNKMPINISCQNNKLNIPRYQQLDDMHIIKVKSTQQIPICNVYHLSLIHI